MTIAQQIATRFNNDGQTWTAPSDNPSNSAGEDHIQDVCLDLAEDTSHTAGADRYDFADGSSIVITSSAWDLGLPGGCFCWEGAGHDDTCDRAQN